MANVNARQRTAAQLLAYTTVPLIPLIAPQESSNDKAVSSTLTEFRRAVLNAGSVTPDNISGTTDGTTNAADGHVLTADGSGGVTWEAIGDASIEIDSTLTGTGTTGDEFGIADGGVGTTQLAANAVTNAKLGSDIDASKITSGTIADERIPATIARDSEIPTVGTIGAKDSLAASDIPNLNASKISAGTLASARIPNLDAAKIATGTIADARIPAGIARDSEIGTIGRKNSLAAADIPSLNASKITSGTFPNGVRANSQTAGTYSSDDNSITLGTNANSTHVATTQFVQNAMDLKVSQILGGAPGALDTLNELAEALGDDASYAATVTNSLALKAPLASPALTGNPTAPTQATGNDSTRLATTAWVRNYAEEELAMGPTTVTATQTSDITVPGMPSALNIPTLGDDSPLGGTTILSLTYSPKSPTPLISYAAFCQMSTSTSSRSGIAYLVLDYRYGTGTWKYITSRSASGSSSSHATLEVAGEWGEHDFHILKPGTQDVTLRIRAWSNGPQRSVEARTHINLINTNTLIIREYPSE